MKKEYDLTKMKGKPVGDKFKNAKVAKTFRIDLDIFTWLYTESQRTGIPYQTLMNSKLKLLMEAEKGSGVVTAEQVRKIVREELEKAS
ncbi:hypothetical protein WDW86_10975 [Bdellovibrionota bacterium FG-2]